MTCSSETISISRILDKNHFRFCVYPEGPPFLVKATILYVIFREDHNGNA